MIELTYTIRRLLVRDELVFKSIVRILSGQTRHSWFYTPDMNADLVVVGPALNIEDCPDSVLVGKVLLELGTSGLSHQYSNVSMQVGDILARLNSLGEQILSGTGTQSAARATEPAVKDHECFALLRWPDWSLMQSDRAYMRIATVLAARPVGVHELANKADADVAVCVEFLRQLHARNLLRLVAPAVVHAPPPTPTAEVAQNSKHPSLWGRIRNRLGISRESRAS